MTSLSLFTFMHWRRKWQPTPVFLPGESQGRGAWWAAIYSVAQSQTQLKRLSSSSNGSVESQPLDSQYLLKADGSHSLCHMKAHVGRTVKQLRCRGTGRGWAERPCSPLQSWLCTVHWSILPGARDPLHVGGQEPGTQHSEAYLTRPPDAGQRGSGHYHLGTQPDSASPNAHLMSHML